MSETCWKPFWEKCFMSSSAATRLSCARSAMALIVRRHCSMASAGWTRKRSSSRSMPAVSSLYFSEALSGMSFPVNASSWRRNGKRIKIEPIRKSELTIAMPTGPSAVSMNGKGEKALMP